MSRSEGYDPIALTEKTERIVVDGNCRKYVQLGRPLRFYGGTTSATEWAAIFGVNSVSAISRCGIRSRRGVFTPQEVFDGLASSARRYGHT